MTKTEFKSEAAKAGIPPELFGAILSGRLYTDGGISISGGKVVGIEWRDAWKTEQRYAYWRGEYEEKFLSKAPYVILSKNRAKYRVEAWRVKAYVNELLSKTLNEKVVNKEPL